MEIISAKSSDELLKKLSTVSVDVPPRGKGRTTQHSELSSIYHLLATLSETVILKYPIRVEHKDRPDIVIFIPSSTIGVEITEAVPENWARADVVAEQKGYESIRFLESFRPGEPPRSKSEINEMAKGTTYGSAWEGDTTEYEWADAIEYFTEQKNKKFTNPEFNKYSKNWLLIYEYWPLPAINQQKAAHIFHSKLIKNGWQSPFDEIFVECSRKIWQFNRQACMSYPVKNLWNGS